MRSIKQQKVLSEMFDCLKGVVTKKAQAGCVQVFIMAYGVVLGNFLEIGPVTRISLAPQLGFPITPNCFLHDFLSIVTTTP